MSIVPKLALAYVREHPGRICFTAVAVIAAACMVVWVVSGYDAMVAQFDDFSADYLGRYDMIVLPQPRDADDHPPELPPWLITALRQDAAVAEIIPVMQLPSRISSASAAPQPSQIGNRPPRGQPPTRPSGRRPRFPAIPMLVGTDAAAPPHELLEGDWIDPNRPDRLEAVISKRAADYLHVSLGQSVLLKSRTDQVPLKLIGIIDQPAQQPMLASRRGMGPGAVSGPAASALYVPTALAEKISGLPRRITYAGVVLKDKSDAKRFRSDWSRRLSEFNPPATLVTFEHVQTGFEEGFSAQNARNQAYSATGLSLLASLFIIFTTLSMGVSERIRQLAILRAVALCRAQIAGLIALESLLLAAIGWLGGLAAGWTLLKITSTMKPDLFAGGASLGPWCIILAGASAFGGALAAAFLPAWQAMRVSPLEAMAPRWSSRSTRWPLPLLAIGALLIALNPILVFVMPIPDESRYGLYAALGSTSMAIGFVLLAPLAVLAAEHGLGPLVARLLAIHPQLVRTQLSGNLWRTIGTTVALTIGLGLFVAMQTWGYSMLGPFVPGDWVPQMLVSLQSGGLPDAEIDAVRHLDGVIPDQCLPLAVEQPRLAADLTHSREHASVTRQDNVIMIGLDPPAGLGGASPLLPLDFVQGNRDDAIARLKSRRGCIIPDHFARAAGLAIGDRFSLLPPEGPEKPVEYIVAGVVSLPGWHWMTKFSGLRRRSGRSAAMIFASLENVRRDFHLEKINFFWLNTRKGVGVDQIGAALQPIAQRHVGQQQPVNAQGMWPVGATMFGPSVRITTADEIRARIQARADGMIWAMCQLPLVTLAVTSLGVVNTILASIRARRWDLGVLRATGLTRSGLLRLILAEALLIGLVACLLSLAFGVMAGWCGVGISQYVSFFGGLAPSLVIPWSKLALGFAACLLLCLAAALVPAIATARTEPLKLLQTGRATM